MIGKDNTGIHISVTSLAEVWIEIYIYHREILPFVVTSLAEVWIEINEINSFSCNFIVTSLAEVWIEIK